MKIIKSIKDILLEIYAWGYAFIFGKFEYYSKTKTCSFDYKGWDVFLINKKDRTSSKKWAIPEFSRETDSLYSALSYMDFEDDDSDYPSVDDLFFFFYYHWRKIFGINEKQDNEDWAEGSGKIVENFDNDEW